ncbi:type IV secretory system conjugative DNA transfer family protein [Campylobacter geochelonis]|uniref:type IV secretory system conjugative DNA transfer family protein n=1 Tax=Campylobacter geochelonis TaxID=1780362 RepID=UPI0007708FFD|nr:type IV secretory system conjugative DNA transfer family protein [Campylobacter geochelonis]CZE46939.1 Type IV secretory pathway%2C VirD4 components [Campylobacter geochelonis]
MSKFSLVSTNLTSCSCKNDKDFLTIPNDFTHVMITGQTGCGKTTSAILPILKDRIEKGHGILVFDYKGKEHKKVKHLALQAGRIKDVVMMGTLWGERVNVLDEISDNVLKRNLKNIFAHQDIFWQNFATNIAFESLQAMKYAYKLAVKFKGFFDINIGNGDIVDIYQIYAKYRPSFTNLARYTFSLEDFEEFYQDIECLASCIDEKEIAKHFTKAAKNKNIEKILTDNIALVEMARKYLANFLTPHKMYKKGNANSDNKSTKYGNYTLMLEAAQELTNNDIINDGNTSLCELLNRGKIVVISCKDIPEAALCIMVDMLLENTISKPQKAKDISIIIDEAQRVITHDFDLHADVLRENKTELILAFQNQEILANKLQNYNKYLELIGNLTTKFFYKNSQRQHCNGENINFSNLAQFECYNGKKTLKTKPLFISDDELNLAEYEYQTENKIQATYTPNTKGNFIVEYDKKNYENDGLLKIVNLKTGETKNIHHSNQTILAKVNKILNMINP